MVENKQVSLLVDVKVFGKASNKIYKTIDISLEDKRDLLTVLRESNIPIASSCFGEGHCQKCLINSNIMACQTQISELLNYPSGEITITIDYL